MAWRPALIAVMLAIASLVAFREPAAALDVEFNGGPVRREVLALYDSRHEKTPATTRLHQFAEMPLNWLGLTLTYVDVNGPLPADLMRYRGIVTWFIEPLANADRYLEWLDGATATGLRLAVFANIAPGASKAAEPTSARVHGRLGLKPTTDYVSITHRARVITNDPQMIGFERPLDKVLPDFPVLLQTDPRITVHLAIEANDQTTSGPAVLVATGRGGGYVVDDYTIVFEPNTDRVRWTLNPFHFLKLSLAPERMPIPDITTLSGRRVYYSHIDGDGWNNISTIDGYRQSGTISAEVIRREAIEPYPDLPVSIGVIAGDLAPELANHAAGRDVARRLYALPQVEVASHTYTHPFDWSFFESYSRAREEALVDKVVEPELPALQRARRLLLSIAGQPLPSNLKNRYIAGSSDLPRTYLRHPFELKKEIAGALAFSQSLAPPGKSAKLYLWSGNCLPFEGAIAATRQSGVRNMNGGDARLDSEYPSVFYIPPIAKPVGAERQIYAANSNENTYTNDWTGPYYGFAMLSETIRNTETPRRLKPFNIYYHMYSGEKESARAALLQNLQLARSIPLTPIPASRYAAMADDFFGVEISQIEADSWSIANRGTVQTVRFEASEGVVVDLEKSRGVLGSTRHSSGALYVALDAAVEPAVVTLGAEPAPAQTAPSPRPPALISARWVLSDLRPDGCGFDISAEGFGLGEMLWQTTPGRRYDVIALRNGRELTRTTLAADLNGLLEASIPADAATAPIVLRFLCRD